MRNIFVFIFLIAAPFCDAFSISKNSSENLNSLDEMSRNLYENIKVKTEIKLAVMEFPYVDMRNSQGPAIIQERLTTIFAKNKRISLIERGMLKKIIEEQKIQLSGIVESTEAVELGHILGADYLLIGTLNDIEKGKTEINARIVDVKSGKIASASSAIIEKTWQDGNISANKPVYSNKPLIQIAILLDTSNSMDGLINQARSYIWKIVNRLSSSEKNEKAPLIQIALYEYGKSSLPKDKGYIRQIMPFTSDLDKISKELFSLTTNGGEEYCGWVIKDAVEKLDWSDKDDVYKAIFIAGNEAFTQGNVDFESAVSMAKEKGIFVNTIFCGLRQEGIAMQWKKAAEIAEGDFSNIEQDFKREEINTPHDDKIAELNQKLNETYIPYGESGKEKLEEKKEMDNISLKAGKGVAFERAAYSASKSAQSYASSWDLITAIENGEIKKGEIKKEELPENLKKMSDKELSSYIDKKIEERKEIRNEIIDLSKKREKYIEENKKGNENTLDKVILDSIKKQAQKKGFNFKE